MQEALLWWTVVQQRQLTWQLTTLDTGQLWQLTILDTGLSISLGSLGGYGKQNH